MTCGSNGAWNTGSLAGTCTRKCWLLLAAVTASAGCFCWRRLLLLTPVPTQSEQSSHARPTLPAHTARPTGPRACGATPSPSRPRPAPPATPTPTVLAHMRIHYMHASLFVFAALPSGRVLSRVAYGALPPSPFPSLFPGYPTRLCQYTGGTVAWSTTVTGSCVCTCPPTSARVLLCCVLAGYSARASQHSLVLPRDQLRWLLVAGHRWRRNRDRVVCRRVHWPSDDVVQRRRRLVQCCQQRLLLS